MDVDDAGHSGVSVVGSLADPFERPPEADAQQGQPENDEGGEEDDPPPPPLPEPHAATS